jgi:DNA-binding NarL/FixJ family response regulator
MTMTATVNANIWNILNTEPTNPELESVLARTLGVLCGEENAHKLRHWWTEFWACINRIIKETARKLRARALQEEASSEIKVRLFELVHEYKAQAYMHLAHDRDPKTFTEFLRDKVRELIRYMRKEPTKLRRHLSKAVAKYGPGEQLVELPAEDGGGSGTALWSPRRDHVATMHARLTVAAVKRQLTKERQRQVLDLVVEEHASVSIAAQRLGVREHTVKRDLQTILKKLGALTVLLVLGLSAALLARHGIRSGDEPRMASAMDDHKGEWPHEPHALTDTVDRPSPKRRSGCLTEDCAPLRAGQGVMPGRGVVGSLPGVEEPRCFVGQILAFAPEDNLVCGLGGLVGHMSTTEFSGRHLSRDDGQSWLATDFPTSARPSDVWGSESENVFAVGQNGAVLHYDGQPWQSMDNLLMLGQVVQTPAQLCIITPDNPCLNHCRGTCLAESKSATDLDFSLDPKIRADLVREQLSAFLQEKNSPENKRSDADECLRTTRDSVGRVVYTFIRLILFPKNKMR